MPKVSIIVPVYNAENYLDRCISAILAQTYSDFELILVNDGSRDRSEEICRLYEAQDSRIKYIKQENKGAGAARNTGIKAASGDYIMFCDADDCVSEKWVEHLCTFAVSENILVIGAYCHKESELAQTKELKITVAKQYENAAYYDFYNAGIAGYLCNALYNARIVKKNGLFLREHREQGDYNEDLLFTLTYMRYVDKIVYTGYADYLYDTRGDSLSRGNRKFYFEKYAEKYELWKGFLTENGLPDKLPELAEKMMYHIIVSLHFCVEDNDNTRFKQILMNSTVSEMLANWNGGQENPTEVKLLKKKNYKALWLFYKVLSLKR